jgi:hypothetical protein
LKNQASKYSGALIVVAVLFGYVFITFIAIPIFFTMALIKQNKATPAE